MNILVVGRGGREHSVIMHLEKSERVQKIFAAPGNGGIEQHATCVPIDEMDISGLVQFAKENAIDLTIVGPENPLNAGIANAFKEAGLRIFAPIKEAAILEGSKDFAKQFMIKHGIPTAAYETFTDAAEAKQYVERKGAPIVIKADGLAEGKGVIVAETIEIALDAIDKLMVEEAFSGAGRKIVIEEFLDGREFSLIAFVHEHHVFPMLAARDHKRAYDNDEGPNTGGMGVFAPVPDITEDILQFTTKEILQKAADGLMEEGRPFTGILYAGLMQTETGTKVIEFNTRFGDPETQVVLPLLENDLVQVIVDVMDGKDPNLAWKEEACVGVVVASKGYPNTYDKGVLLPQNNTVENTFIIQAGTKQTEEGLVSNGGRVLLIGGIGKDLESARKNAYENLRVYDDTDAFFYRTDIGVEKV
ncbi:phosphoribosylamine--glycine ligase [Pseudogracilibacillus auburnensis]|uniref:Phosphoribosylamine--glycine ligase n=1 Tax=Pseudogracilibacillus auburnensis TaxID=1494959 RepID=A0A2V3W923_9BACI|nr:phosphoribosylamine--glycine ligase [Pseudogracilibacillus auburnensis]MBO1001179.1 phosphoribosylamine--glycine ligase [Pseudogracilibacillus auburnensis]PXW90612.1 phosphoribosylamine--glycine ligase [Pseudogracilibacillus auburnensis]